MARETRINLIFLAVLLALLAPGALILVRKKMQPGAKPILGEPDVRRESVPYMLTWPQPPGMKRSVPPRTAAWVRETARSLGVPSAGPATRPAGDGQAEVVVSRQRWFELLGAAPSGDGTMRAWLLAWEPPPGVVGPTMAVAAESGGQRRDGRVVSSQAVPLPPEVRKELQEAGYIRPPPAVTFIEVEAPVPAAGSAWKLTLGGSAGSDDVAIPPEARR